MEKAICKQCGKVIEGYGKNHADFLMKQHMLKHEGEDPLKTKKKTKEAF